MRWTSPISTLLCAAAWACTSTAPSDPPRTTGPSEPEPAARAEPAAPESAVPESTTPESTAPESSAPADSEPSEPTVAWPSMDADVPARDGGFVYTQGNCAEDVDGVVAVLCHQDGAFQSDCDRRSPVGATVFDADGRTGRLGKPKAGDPDFDEETCQPLDPDPDLGHPVSTGPGFAGGPCSRSAPPSWELSDDAPPSGPPLTFTPEIVDAYAPFADMPTIRGTLTHAIRAPREARTLEVDGDGQPDHLGTYVVDDGRECWILAAVWGDGRTASILDHASSCHEPVDESDHFGVWDYHFGRLCFDLDGDGRLEFEMSDGPETQRSEAIFEWDGSGLEAVGAHRYLGD